MGFSYTMFKMFAQDYTDSDFITGRVAPHVIATGKHLVHES